MFAWAHDYLYDATTFWATNIYVSVVLAFIAGGIAIHKASKRPLR